MMLLATRVVLRMFLGAVLVLPTPAQSAEESGELFRFTEEMKMEFAKEKVLEACGDYFVRADLSEGRRTFFVYLQVIASVTVPVLVKAAPEALHVSINEAASPPFLQILRNAGRNRFLLHLNSTDHVASLPCLGKGPEI